MSSHTEQHLTGKSGRVCRSCGAVLGPRSSGTICPRCALRNALVPDQTENSTSSDGAHARQFGEYQLHGVIGRGGMGVIYKARHARLNRWVALKVMAGGEFASADFKQRFRTEAQAAAALEHPNIVPIYEVGEEDSQPYFSMKLVEGGTLTSLRGGVSLEAGSQPNVNRPRSGETSLQRVVGIVITLARAVQFAHDRGVLHRDLKPNNVLVDSAGDVFLTDFGLAKLVEKDGSLTQSMAVLGTPSYMAPEQARGETRHITTAADVYGLGAILYELIAGRPPFTGQSSIEIIRQVVEQEPTAPSVVVTRNGGTFTTSSAGYAARDLDTICLKCLEKEPHRRYASARALANDLQRWLDHMPIHARHASAMERIQKWIRRKPASAALIATVAVSLAALGVGGLVFTAQVMKARTAAEAANRELSRDLFIREWQDAESLCEQGKTAQALAWFARAARQHPQDVAVQTRLLSLLSESSFVVPADRPLVHGAPVNNAAFLSEGRHLVTAGSDGTVRVWPLNSVSNSLLLSNRFDQPAVASLPRANLMLVDDARSLSLWDLNGLVRSVPLTHRVDARVPTSLDGQFALIHGPERDLHVWALPQLKLLAGPFEQRPQPFNAQFSPDGKYVLTCRERKLSAWEISSGREVWETPETPLFRGEGIVQAQFHPGGKRLFVSCWLGPAGGELSGWTFEPAPAGATLPAVGASEGWVLATRSVIGTWTSSSDGNQLYVGDAEGHLGVVDLATRQFHPLNGEHDGRVTWMCLSRLGNLLATTSVDGTARLWDIRMRSPEARLFTNGTSIWDAKFSPDSQWVIYSGSEAAEIRDAHSGSLQRRLSLNQFITSVNFSPDSRKVVTCGGEGGTAVWDVATGTTLFPILTGEPADYVEFSGDGKRFLILSAKATVEVRETETGRLVGPILTNSTRGVAAHFSPDGRSLVVGTDNGIIEFWSLPDGRRLEKPARHKDVVWTARFSRNAKLLLTASRDRTATLWDAETGERVREFRHDQQVYCADFSPEGLRIVTGDASRKAHVWDPKTGQRLFSLFAHPGGVWYAEFSSDGRILLTGDDAGNARVWEASSGLPLSGWIHNGVSLKRTHFNSDNHMAVSAAQNGSVRLWPVMLASLPAPSWLPDLAEAVAGRRLRNDGPPTAVPAEQWQTLHASLSSLPGTDFYARWARWFFVERMKPNPPEFR